MTPQQTDSPGLYHLPPTPGFLGGADLRPRLIGLVVILFTSTIATQYLARQLAYQDALGPPLWTAPVLKLPVYAPYHWAQWAWRYRKIELETVAKPVRYATFIGLGGLFLAFFCTPTSATARARKLTQNMEQLHGSAHWAAPEDVKRSGLLGNTDGVCVGAWQSTTRRWFLPLWCFPQKKTLYLRHNGEGHVLCFAPTGAGKTTSLVVPTLFSWSGSVVVYDLKGENYKLTAGYRAECGHVVFRFAPLDPINSNRFNPLEEIRLGTLHDVADAQNIAHIVMRTGKEPRDPHWYDTSEALHVGIILHACYAARREGRTSNLAEVRSMLCPIGDEETEAQAEDYDADTAFPVTPKTINTFREFLRGIRTYDHGTGWWGTGTHPAVAKSAQQMLNRANPEFSSVLSTAITALRLYEDPVACINTSASDFAIRDLVDLHQPVSLYLVVPPSDAARLRPLVRLFLTLMINRLTEEQTVNRQKLLFMIDEFPSLKHLEIFADAMSFMRSYGLKAYLICQDIRQLEEVYGPNESIVSNCRVHVVYAPSHDTSRLVSEMAGKMTVQRADYAWSGKRRGISFQNVTASVHQGERPLLTPDEARRLPEYASLIFPTGLPPIVGRKSPYYTDPWMAEKAAIPPPLRELVRIVPAHQPAPQPEQEGTNAQEISALDAPEDWLL
jgi:type IV secretion system protein VirD4